MSVSHHHHHHHEIEDEESERKTRVVVIITLVTMVVEIYAGIVTKSMGLLADGWHMGTHAGALSITLYAYYYARTEKSVKDKRESVMALAGFTSGIILALVAIYIGLESIDKVLNPPEIQYKQAIAVAFFGLIVNIVCAYILGIEGHDHDHSHDHDHEHDHDHDHSHDNKSENLERGTWDVALNTYKEDFDAVKSVFDSYVTPPDEIEDLNRRGAYMHVLADALVSILILLALILGLLNSKLAILDPMIGIIGGIIIARWSLSLITESKNRLLGID
ncbi:MAG: CDF family Co(II)/Ni(II) efflux transporter DmeF [Candidatus Thermoplasmatota archaeon]|nr:CDF family Co(II)/Ni(II) efflux transporter DmeF [Candidatus Thermoplasmatota archaeon]